MKSLLLSALLAASLISPLHAATTVSSAQTVSVSVTEKGFEPSTLKVESKKDVILMVTRKTDATCAKEIVFPAMKIKKELPLNKVVAINLGKLAKGNINFSCAMDMVSGVINVQ
jgi:plastocyanin domain-containing protein